MKREFQYITRQADSIARERKEKFNLSSEDFVEDRNEMIVDAVAQNVKELVECTNASGHQEQIIEGIMQGLTGSHRFLQAEFMQTLAKVLIEYGNLPEGHYDGRNAHAVKMAGRMGVVSTLPQFEPSDIEDILARR